jgi:hypothetical protein
MLHYDYITLHKVFQKELYNGIRNVTVWQVLQKRLHSGVHKLSIVQGVERFSKTCHTVTFGIPL